MKDSDTDTFIDTLAHGGGMGTLSRWSLRESSKEGTWGTASLARCSGRENDTDTSTDTCIHGGVMGTLSRWSSREGSEEGTWGTTSTALCSGRGSESLEHTWGRGGMGSSTMGASGREGGSTRSPPGGGGAGRAVHHGGDQPQGVQRARQVRD